MRLLLDTHALLWWLADDPALAPDARQAVGDAGNVVFVSAVSAWEIVIKRSLGKLVVPANWAAAVAAEPFRRLGVTWEHALRVGRLPAVHRDPFDRLLVAQALHESLVLVTRDARLARYGAAVLPA